MEKPNWYNKGTKRFLEMFKSYSEFPEPNYFLFPCFLFEVVILKLISFGGFFFLSFKILNTHKKFACLLTLFKSHTKKSSHKIIITAPCYDIPLICISVHIWFLSMYFFFFFPFFFDILGEDNETVFIYLSKRFFLRGGEIKDIFWFVFKL